MRRMSKKKLAQRREGKRFMRKRKEGKNLCVCVRVCVYVLITLGNEDSCPGKVEVAQNGVEIRESCWPWLREKFKTQFGVALGTYLRNYRIRRAIGLLTTSSLSLEEVADRCGYGSAASFHRAFQEITGTTPGQFRRS